MRLVDVDFNHSIEKVSRWNVLYLIEQCRAYNAEPITGDVDTEALPSEIWKLQQLYGAGQERAGAAARAKLFKV